MKLDINKIATLFGILIPLWGGALFLINYESTLVKHHELAAMDLDARIERTEILIAVYSRSGEELNETEKNVYSRAKKRLDNLERQRDELLGVE